MALKKAGQLQGDEVVVRRSSLDECRGDRFERMMLALSELALRTDFENKFGGSGHGWYLEEAKYGFDAARPLTYGDFFPVVPTFPDFPTLKRSLAPPAVSFYVASLELQNNLEADTFAAEIVSRHSQQRACLEFGACVSQRWDAVCREAALVAKAETKLLQGQPYTLKATVAEAKARLQRLAIDVSDWIGSTLPDCALHIADLLADTLQAVSLSSTHVADDNCNALMPQLQVPGLFSSPDWVASLKQIGPSPLLPAALGFNLEGLAIMWKVALCFLLGTFGGQVETSFLEREMASALSRCGVPIADSHGKSEILDSSAKSSGGRIGFMVNSVVAESVSGRLAGINSAAHEMESSVKNLQLLAAQTGKTILWSGDLADKAGEARSIALPVSTSASNRHAASSTGSAVAPSASITELRVEASDLHHTLDRFAIILPVESSEDSVSKESLDRVPPPAISLKLGGARSLLHTETNVNGALAFPPTPPRLVGRSKTAKGNEMRVSSRKAPDNPRAHPPRQTDSAATWIPSLTGKTSGTPPVPAKGTYSVPLSSGSKANAMQGLERLQPSSDQRKFLQTSFKTVRGSSYTGKTVETLDVDERDNLVFADPNLFSTRAEIPRTPIAAQNNKGNPTKPLLPETPNKSTNVSPAAINIDYSLLRERAEESLGLQNQDELVKKVSPDSERPGAHASQWDKFHVFRPEASNKFSQGNGELQCDNAASRRQANEKSLVGGSPPRFSQLLSSNASPYTKETRTPSNSSVKVEKGEGKSLLIYSLFRSLRRARFVVAVFRLDSPFVTPRSGRSGQIV